jgi:hypothetical protein
MASETLVSTDIEKGRQVVRALDQRGVEVRSAFWYYLPDSGDWRLILALPLVDREGQRVGYERVQQTLVHEKQTGLPLSRISVVGSADLLPRAIASAITTPPKALADIRFTHNVVDNVLIEDAYIYRSRRG